MKREVSDFVTIIDSDISGFNLQRSNKNIITLNQSRNLSLNNTKSRQSLVTSKKYSPNILNTPSSQQTILQDQLKMLQFKLSKFRQQLSESLQVNRIFNKIIQVSLQAQVNQSFEQLITLLHNISSTLLKDYYEYAVELGIRFIDLSNQPLISTNENQTFIQNQNLYYKVYDYFTDCMDCYMILMRRNAINNTTTAVDNNNDSIQNSNAQVQNQSNVNLQQSRTNRSNHIYSSRKCGDLISLMDQARFIVGEIQEQFRALSISQKDKILYNEIVSKQVKIRNHLDHLSSIDQLSGLYNNSSVYSQNKQSNTTDNHNDNDQSSIINSALPIQYFNRINELAKNQKQRFKPTRKTREATINLKDKRNEQEVQKMLENYQNLDFHIQNTEGNIVETDKMQNQIGRKRVFGDNRENVKQFKKGQIGAIKRAIRIGKEYEVIDNEQYRLAMEFTK